LVEPHPHEQQKEWHVFRCEACGTTRSYLTSR
jgi:ribosomal protein S14